MAIKIRFEERCECGALIVGFSKQHVKANMILHKKSKKHKELMEIRKIMENQKEVKNNV